MEGPTNKVLIAFAAIAMLAGCASTPLQTAARGDAVGQCRAQAAKLKITLGEPDGSKIEEFFAIGPRGEDRFTTNVWLANNHHDEVACTCRNGEPILLAVGDDEVWER